MSKKNIVSLHQNLHETSNNLWNKRLKFTVRTQIKPWRCLWALTWRRYTSCQV